jgi:hypothetical protein
MIDVKEAAQAASNFIAELYSDKAVSDIRLEEVELSKDKCWLITLSFSVHETLFVMKRLYKIVKVDRNTGEALSMKIRESAHEAA